MASRSQEKESRVCSAINDLIDNSDAETVLIKNRWRENYDMFVYGSRNEDKQDWQTNFSVNKLQTSIRTSQGRLVNILVNNPEWYELCPSGYANKDAATLAPAFKKIMDYYLKSSRFKRHAGTFFMNSLISSGNLNVGWKQRLVQNPAWTLEKTEKERQQIQMRLAKNVANPQVEDPMLGGSDLEQKLNESLDEFAAEAQGETLSKKKVDQYIQIGCLDFLDINHEKRYWDPNVQYMEDSVWGAFKYDVNLYELNMQAKLGMISKKAVDRIGDQKDAYVTRANSSLRYKNTVASAKGKSNLVELTVYYGPLIIKGEIVKDRYFALIANGSIILKEGEYPYWEPPGHLTALVSAAVRQIPGRATGAGIGDSAVELQRIYDSNWQLICDTFRFGISGINVVNWQNLVDKGQLLEGIYPGMTLEVRGKPEDNFSHIDLTSNLENQAHPIQNMFEQAIDSLTGVNELMTGGNNPYSRTSAAETGARLDAGNQSVNIIALDLEQNFLIPTLEKCFARILQFGISEISSNPELQALLTEDEVYQITKLGADTRMNILNQWYTFKISGFSQVADSDENAKRDNELIQMVNSGGLLAQLINIPELMKQYFKNRKIKDPELLLINDSPLSLVMAENQALLTGHQIMPNQNDDHEFHLKNQGALAASPYATPEVQMHVQMHQQMLQQMQMAQQQQQQGQQPPQGQPPVQ